MPNKRLTKENDSQITPNRLLSFLDELELLPFSTRSPRRARAAPPRIAPNAESCRKQGVDNYSHQTLFPNTIHYHYPRFPKTVSTVWNDAQSNG